MPNYIINVKEKGAKKASKNIGGLSNSLGGMASKAALAAGAFFGAGMLLSGMKSAIDLAGRQELAEKKLEASLGRTSTALLEQARALQQVSTFGDEAIIEAQALIAAFVDDEEAVKKATAATLDLAAAKGMDLTVAADLVSKTLGSSTNALSRYGIQVEGAVGSTERLESLTGNLADVFGGQASAQAETMSGKLAQMKNALGDAAEAFGELLFPLVMPLADGLKLIGESAVSVMGAFKSMITPDTLNLLTEADLKTQSFKEKLASLSAVELLESARGFRHLGDSIKVLSEEEINNLNLLNEAITNNAELQKALNSEITASEIRKTGAIVDNSKRLKGIKEEEIKDQKTIAELIKIAKLERQEATKEELKGYAMTRGSAREAMIEVVRAETMEAISGLIASIFKNFPFPLSAVLAAGAGATVSSAITRNLQAHVPQFATGGDFITNGSQLIMVGDNPSGRERVQITP